METGFGRQRNPLGPLLLVVSIFLFSSCIKEFPAEGADLAARAGLPSILSQDITIASFNIQVFGQSKASKAEVMSILAQVIRLYDVVAIQEIRDKEGRAIEQLHDLVNQNGRQYDLLVGPRVGRSSSKEQYAFFYDLETLSLLPDFLTYDDDNDGDGSNDLDDSLHPGDLFEREPLMARFQVKNGTFDFVLINIHTKPSTAAMEIGILAEVIRDAPALLNEADIICLGDFNADGRYFNEDTYTFIFPAGSFGWLIGNNRDTTVAESHNTYDRIVTTASLFEDFSGQIGILRFEDYFDLPSRGLEPAAISDHYPVWAVFHANRDTD